MNRHEFISRIGMAGIGFGTLSVGIRCVSNSKQPSKKLPNIIILFADDMGYGDWEGGGHPTVSTPYLKKMAGEGVVMTQFYSGCPVCSPSRAALLTGRNFIRTGVKGVFSPNDDRGMSTDEITIADALKQRNYATACIGKWHLGEVPAYRPQRQGFDYYYGLLHSNNMYDFRLFQNDKIIEDPVDQSTLTKRYTEQAIAFIERSLPNPFFLYLPYTMPHVPVHASESFRGKSLNGIYGDAIEEIDWSVGQIIETLHRLEIDDNTLVIFTSDNGPALYKPVPRGSSGLFQGCKADTWEGGMRVPGIFWMPGTLPKGTVARAVGSVIDLFPTCLSIAGIPLPTNRPYDGIDLMPVFMEHQIPERTIYYYRDENMHAIRKGKWKLHFRITLYEGRTYHLGRKTIELDHPLLFDLEEDPSEHYDLSAKYPEIVDKLTSIAAAYRDEILQYNENADLIKWFNTEKKPGKLTGKN